MSIRPKTLVFEKEAYVGKTLLLIGPGQSSQLVNLGEWAERVDFTCSINDACLHFKTDFWLSGVGFGLLRLYFRQNFSFFNSPHTLKIFSSHAGPPIKRTFPSRAEALQMVKELKLPNSHVITRYPCDYPENDTQLHTDFVQAHWNKTALDRYLLTPFTGSTSSALQTLYKLGFKTVYVIGFLDNLGFRHRSSAISSHLPQKPAADPEKLKIRFAYLDLIYQLYQAQNRNIFNLCPEKHTIYSGFPSVALEPG